MEACDVRAAAFQTAAFSITGIFIAFSMYLTYKGPVGSSTTSARPKTSLKDVLFSSFSSFFNRPTSPTPSLEDGKVLNPVAIEMAGRRSEGAAEIEGASKDFVKTLEGHAAKQFETAHEKVGAASRGERGLGEVDAVNQDALSKVATGGSATGLFEKLTIAINFLQNFSLVVIIEVEWPEEFKKLVGWLDVFSLDLSGLSFGGESLGLWITNLAGLLVPLWLVVLLD